MITNYTIGQWSFAVDKERTNLYYTSKLSAEQPTTQCSRNYSEFLKNLTASEQEFFNSMGIIPALCTPDAIGLSEDNFYPTFGFYPVAAEITAKPEEQSISLDEALEKNFELDWNDTSIQVGRYNIEVQFDGSMFNPLSEELPEGFINLAFSVDEMPWLLDEDCTDVIYEPNRWWQIRKRIKSRIRNKRIVRRARRETIDEFLTCIDDIKYLKLTSKETEELVVSWLKNIGGRHQYNHNKKYCISNRRYSNYLWHLFSYDIVAADEGELAIEKFNDLPSGPCMLIMDYEQFAIILDDVHDIGWERLSKFGDIVLCAPDFSWTFCTTHEDMIGPYFYKKPHWHASK